MKRALALAVTALPLAALGGHVQQTPMEKVAGLLTKMKSHIEADGMLEQQSYDKYACWCEDTMSRKAKDISDAKATIEEVEHGIVKLKAEISSIGVEIQQAQKDIAANIEAQREATSVRDKEHETYAAEKTESEQCSGALEAAIKVLSGASEKKKAFLETLQEAQLLSVVAGVRSVFTRSAVVKNLAEKDMELVQRFIEHPDEFVGSHADTSGAGGFLSAVQTANNPFGDYAPQSTQIQGILKGMYDTFLGDLERSNAEEAEAQKSYEALMATKQQELDTLRATLQAYELDQAEKAKALSDSQAVLDDTKAQLEADEKLFASVKTGCSTKATEWSQRTQLRTQELQGIGEAIKILTSDEARATFQSATTTFAQLSSAVARAAPRAQIAVRTAKVSKLAAKLHDVGLAQIAAQLRDGGHFDKVMAAIDQMMELLRHEEQDDIAHRDRCQNAENKNSNDLEDLNSAIDKAGKTIDELNNEAKTLTAEVDALKGEIEATKKSMADALKLRNDDMDAFRKAVKDDTEAVALLDQAIEAVQRFYKRNNKEIALVQQPTYTQDQDKAPETTWSGGDYGGKQSETRGIVAILEMIKEDLLKEIDVSKEDDAAAQAQYEKERSGMQETLSAQTALKMNKERELNDIEAKIQDSDEFKKAKSLDQVAEQQLKDTIYSDCAWVAEHFETRRVHRKAEMDGLVEAKGYLAGVESGDELA